MRFAWQRLENLWLIFGINKRLLTIAKPMVNNAAMNLKNWIEAERGRAMALAKAIDVSQAFVSNMVNGEKAIPAEHCKAIEAFSDGVVTCQEMRPHDWHKYWPELAAQPQPVTQGA